MVTNEKQVVKISFNTRKVKRGLLILIVNIVPILIFLGLGEFYLRKLGREPYVRTYPEQHESVGGRIWAQDDPVLGWTVNPNWYPGEINSQGFRDRKPYAHLPPKSDKTRVMVLGDSFVFGVSLAEYETITSLLQAKLSDNYEVYNFGVPSWGIDQMYLAYHHYKDLVDPDIVILAFIDDDVQRALESYRSWERLNKPSFTIDNGEMVPQTPVSKWQLYFNETIGKSVFLSRILHEVYYVTEAIPITHHILVDIERDVRERGAKFVVIRIPVPDHTKPTQNLRRRLMNYDQILENTEATYLDITEELTQIPNWKKELYFPRGHDSQNHLNAVGNEVWADYIMKHVFDENQVLISQ